MATTDADMVIREFASFLATSYGFWRTGAEMTLDADKVYFDESFDDWAQANWELLIERPLLGSQEYLEIYGSGSDYETGIHSRVFFRSATETHRISLMLEGEEGLFDELNDREIPLADYRFERFVAMKDGFYHDIPPFDHVLLLHNERNFDDVAVVHRDRLRYAIEPINKAEQSAAHNGGKSPRES